MANLKSSFNYWQIDVRIFSNPKVRRLIRLQEKRCNMNPGIAVLVFLDIQFMTVRSPEGYYINMDENLIMDISDEIKVDEDYVSSIIDDCVSVGLFDEKLAREGVLTSVDIQENYSATMSRCKRLVKVNKYKLLPDSSEISTHSSEELRQNAEECLHSSEESTHSSDSLPRGRSISISRGSSSNVSISTPTPPSEMVLPDIENYFLYKNKKNWKTLAAEYYNSRTSTGWKTQSGVLIVNRQADLELWISRSQEIAKVFEGRKKEVFTALGNFLHDHKRLDLLRAIRDIQVNQQELTLFISDVALQDYLENQCANLRVILSRISVSKLRYRTVLAESDI